MHSYHVRVELHNAIDAHYNILHTQMEKVGFSRTIISRNGNKWQLPTAEYVINGNYTVSGVVEAARKAAALTGKTSSIFGVQFVDWQGDNLTQVR